MRPNGAELIAACLRRSTRYCGRLAGPSCPWMARRIIIETPPSSHRSRWMVAKTDLSPQGVVGLARAHSTSGNCDYAAKARPWKAISNKLA